MKATIRSEYRKWPRKRYIYWNSTTKHFDWIWNSSTKLVDLINNNIWFAVNLRFVSELKQEYMDGWTQTITWRTLSVWVHERIFVVICDSSYNFRFTVVGLLAPLYGYKSQLWPPPIRRTNMTCRVIWPWHKFWQLITSEYACIGVFQKAKVETWMAKRCSNIVRRATEQAYLSQW